MKFLFYIRSKHYEAYENRPLKSSTIVHRFPLKRTTSHFLRLSVFIFSPCLIRQLKGFHLNVSITMKSKKTSEVNFRGFSRVLKKIGITTIPVFVFPEPDRQV